MGAIRDGSWLDEARVRRVAIVMLVVSVATLAFFAVTAHGTLDWKGRPLGTDFSEVYVAGKMTWAGEAARVWDWPTHFAAQRAFHHSPGVDVYGWHYPPPFLLVASLLALLPYIPALLVWQAATLGPLAVAAQRFTGRRDGWLFIVGAPVTLICLTHGHNGFLTALLLGGGLLLLDRKPFLAGLLLGCLVYKPQFALVLPLVVIASRRWAAIPGALLSAGALLGLTLALWGWPVWQAFADSLPLTRHVVIEQGNTGWYKIFSPFSAVRAWGLAVAPAYAVQSAFTLSAAAAATWLAWRGRPLLRNAATAAAVLIATPYVLDYDYVVLLLAIGFLWKDGEDHGWGAWEKSLLALAWIAPLFARQFAQVTLVPLGLMTACSVLAIAAMRGRHASKSRDVSPRSREAGGPPASLDQA
ncbi:glycosyltransferase family 87 protein [Sphingomonas sp. ASV193]|uniref:glycosyltransferase family 87 protein n=1 Tax=Sphingomonas sp. ASV193 TaxID=3144405 RepID=UPI0032E91F08